eukprot:353808-Chlamydomonas_euryale.AAC.7
MALLLAVLSASMVEHNREVLLLPHAEGTNPQQESSPKISSYAASSSARASRMNASAAWKDKTIGAKRHASVARLSAATASVAAATGLAWRTAQNRRHPDSTAATPCPSCQQFAVRLPRHHPDGTAATPGLQTPLQASRCSDAPAAGACQLQQAAASDLRAPHTWPAGGAAHACAQTEWQRLALPLLRLKPPPHGRSFCGSVCPGCHDVRVGLLQQRKLLAQAHGSIYGSVALGLCFKDASTTSAWDSSSRESCSPRHMAASMALSRLASASRMHPRPPHGTSPVEKAARPGTWQHLWLHRAWPLLQGCIHSLRP